MRSLLAFLAATIAIAPAALRADDKATFDGRKWGFSIDIPPGFTVSKTNLKLKALAKGESQGLAIFTAAQDDGFSANFNVIAVGGPTTRDEVITSTKDEMKKIGLDVVAEKKLSVSGRDAVMLEYAGPFGGPGGRRLHFLTLTVIDGDRTFSLTGTATKDDYPSREKTFHACVESFKLTAEKPYVREEKPASDKPDEKPSDEKKDNF
jgi:hypothetical protein